MTSRNPTPRMNPMDDTPRAVAQACLDGAEAGTLHFPEILDRLGRAGFESYAVDFRSASATYYRADGESLVLPQPPQEGPIAAAFDTAALRAAIGEAQRQAPGYSYRGFCARARAAGCVGYIVSLAGRRAVYLGRTAETHVEHFPPVAAAAAP